MIWTKHACWHATYTRRRWLIVGRWWHPHSRTYCDQPGRMFRLPRGFQPPERTA